MPLRDISAGMHHVTATPASITESTRRRSRASPPAWPGETHRQVVAAYQVGLLRANAGECHTGGDHRETRPVLWAQPCEVWVLSGAQSALRADAKKGYRWQDARFMNTAEAFFALANDLVVFQIWTLVLPPFMT